MQFIRISHLNRTPDSCNFEKMYYIRKGKTPAFETKDRKTGSKPCRKIGSKSWIKARKLTSKIISLRLTKNIYRNSKKKKNHLTFFKKEKQKKKKKPQKLKNKN